MKKGCVRLDGKTLTPGKTRVTILRRGYMGMTGLFKGRARGGRLMVNVFGSIGFLPTTKLYLNPAEIEVR